MIASYLLWVNHNAYKQFWINGALPGGWGKWVRNSDFYFMRTMGWFDKELGNNAVSTDIRGMILKFWSWCDISVTCNATCLKIVPHDNIFFVYTLLWHVLFNLKEQPEIYHKTVMPSMHWPIKQTVHVRDATILTSAISAFRFYGCSMIIPKPICSEEGANFLYDLGFLGL